MAAGPQTHHKAHQHVLNKGHVRCSEVQRPSQPPLARHHQPVLPSLLNGRHAGLELTKHA